MESFTVSRDLMNDAHNLSKASVLRLLLIARESDETYLYNVTEWDSDIIEEDGQPLIVKQMNGEEWMIKNCS